MKNIKKYIKLASISAAMGLGVCSCSLDMLPLNEVVLENFWTDKSDVESVVASCYSGVAEGKYLHNIMVWGEGRSDNTAIGSDASEALKFLMKGSMKTTNEYCDWSALYSVINRCNTVLHYAPIVAERDPNFTESDLKITVAEMKGLRAMTYFYLIKTFKDVPFTTEPTIDDDIEQMKLCQTSFEKILDTLIVDLESCVKDAPVRYREYEKSVGRITQPAIYSLLAEMYLWRASDANRSKANQMSDYDQCVIYCNKVIDYKKELYMSNSIDGVNLDKLIDKNVWSTYGYPLLSETESQEYTTPAAYKQIFGEGYSFESIFEYASRYANVARINVEFACLYGGTKNNNSTTYMVADGQIMETKPTSTTYSQTLFPCPTDIRSISSFSWSESSTFPINKYCVKSPSTSYNGKQTISYDNADNIPKHSVLSETSQYFNYVFYRLTEIMLFRAEAEIQLAGLKEGNASLSDSLSADSVYTANGVLPLSSKELYDDAKNIIRAVYVRSNPYSSSAKSALPEFKFFGDYELGLMNERRREFLFEGKRYYDLVRQARRDGNTSRFISALSKKYADGGASVAIKMRNMDFMYMPILKKQMKLNDKYKQNSAYLDEETIENN